MHFRLDITMGHVEKFGGIDLDPNFKVLFVLVGCSQFIFKAKLACVPLISKLLSEWPS